MSKQKRLLEGNSERSDGGGRCLAESQFNLSEPSPVGRSFVPADSIISLPALSGCQRIALWCCPFNQQGNWISGERLDKRRCIWPKTMICAVIRAA